MPARCCCIIPLRGGVIISGIIMLVISLALLAATFTHKNPMIIHLSITHVVLPWIYIGFLAATAIVSLFVIISGLVAKLNMARLTKFLLWLLVFLLTIWEAICFILSLTNRSKSLAACEEANPALNNGTTPDSHNATVTIGGYSTTFLGMQPGNTYGLADCAQAVQADVIGSAILLFFGQVLMFYAASVVGSFTAKLRERKLGHRLRDLEWDDNLDELASTYRTDAYNAPRYPLNELGKKKKGFLKNLKFGK